MTLGRLIELYQAEQQGKQIMIKKIGLAHTLLKMKKMKTIIKINKE